MKTAFGKPAVFSYQETMSAGRRLEGVHQGQSHCEVYGGSERLHHTKYWRAEQAWKKFERHPASRSVRYRSWRRHDGEPPTSPHFRCVQQIKLPEGGACSATEARYPLGQASVAQQAPRTILTAPSTHQRAVQDASKPPPKDTYTVVTLDLS